MNPTSMTAPMDPANMIHAANAFFLIQGLILVAFFSYLAVRMWLKSRVREKEAYFKNEAIKKIAESPDGAAAVLQYMREEKTFAEKQRREKLRLGGVVITAAGFGLTICLFAFERAEHDPDPNYLVGLILLLIGAAVLTYTYWLAPKE